MVTLLFAFLVPPPQRVDPAVEALARGAVIHQEVCSNCHGNDGKGRMVEGAGLTLALAPPFAGSSRVTGHRDYVVLILLHGLTGTVEGKIYPGAMQPFTEKSDEWIASAASYVRTNFGNAAGPVSPEDVARVREATKDRKEPFTIEELQARLVPKVMEISAGWRTSASVNAAAASRALTSTGWTSGSPQRLGMWFQVELPAATTITQVQFFSATTTTRGLGAPPNEGATSGAGATGEGAQTPTAPGTRAPAGEGARGRARGVPPPLGVPTAGGAPAPVGDLPVATSPGAPRSGGARDPVVPSGVTSSGGPRTGPPTIGYPRGYRVQVSMDGSKWSESIAAGPGTGEVTEITFAPVRARFIRITQTDAAGGAPPWSIVNLRVWEIGK